jgi:hypothetical protein
MGVATPTICEVPFNSEYFLILTGDTEIQFYPATGKHSNEVLAMMAMLMCSLSYGAA